MRALVLATAVAAAGCGGASSDAKSPGGSLEDGEVEQSRPGALPMTSAEIGALDEDAVEATFNGAMEDLMGCRNRGAERIEFLGGSVRFFVKIDGSGNAAHVHLEKTTLGDRETEKCMLGVLKGLSWPKPVGGEHGIAQSGFSFDANDVRPPTEWGDDNVADVVSSLSGELDGCGGSGGFTATLYVDTDGSVLGAGAAPPDEGAESQVDCIVDVLKGAKFSSPGSWPAKVTVRL